MIPHDTHIYSTSNTSLVPLIQSTIQSYHIYVICAFTIIVHLFLHLLTNFHQLSPLLTSSHLFSPLITSIHLYSPLLTSSHHLSPLLASSHLPSYLIIISLIYPNKFLHHSLDIISHPSLLSLISP